MRDDNTDDRKPDADTPRNARANIMKTFAALKRELAFYRAVLGDPRTPAVSRWCLRAAVAYLLSPIDLIPDFVPVLGQLDDVIIVSLLLAIARYFVPPEVMRDHRRRTATAQQNPAGADVDKVPPATEIPLNGD